MLLNRRDLTHSLGATGLGLLLPAAISSGAKAAFETLSWFEFQAVHLKSAMDQAAANGARTISLSICGQPRDARYTAIMVPERAPVVEERFLSRDIATFNGLLTPMTAKGWDRSS